MKKIILLTFIYLNILNLNAQEISISDSAIISLLTCSPGKEVYAKFGHTAIRINDVANGIDIVYNYGIFSFETEDFYFKFVKGYTDYQLGVYETNFFLPEYAARNSIVWEQILNLKPIEKRRLINSLKTNYEPQNRIYRYNFIFDNCSTRPRDKIIAALHGYVKFQTLSDTKTFRQWIGAYVGTDTWLKFGIDIIFGIDADRVASENESMFLPEVLMANFQSAQITSRDGINRELVSETKVLTNKKEEKAEDESWILKPLTISLFLLIIGAIVTLWDRKRQRHSKLFDTILLIVSGLASIVVFYLMFFSIHPLVKYNLNILWLNPLNLIVAVIIWIRRLRKYLFFYQMLNIGLLSIALFSFALSSQSFNVATFPLIVLLLMRSTAWFAHTKRRLFKYREFSEN